MPAPRALGLLLLLLALLALGLVLALRALGDAVRDEVDHVQPGYALLVQVVHGMRVLLAEDRHQHVGAGDFLLAVAGDCTCMMARWITRWKPSVGCVSASEFGGSVGVLSK